MGYIWCTVALGILLVFMIFKAFGWGALIAYIVLAALLAALND